MKVPCATTETRCSHMNTYKKKINVEQTINSNLSHFFTLKDQRESKITIPFTIATKRIKYLGINLHKEAKDLYPENYKILMKETEADTKRWRDIACSWTGRIL